MSTPDRARRGTWLLAEFVVVVLGVAVGLAVDGWRADIGREAARSEYRARLAGELESIAGRANAMEWWTEKTIGIGATITAAYRGGSEPALSDDSLAVLLAHLAVYPRMTFPKAAWDDLVATGSLQLFDQQLRGHLASDVYSATARLELRSSEVPTALLRKVQGIVPAELGQEIGESGPGLCELRGERCNLSPEHLAQVKARAGALTTDPQFYRDLNAYVWWATRLSRDAKLILSSAREALELVGEPADSTVDAP